MSTGQPIVFENKLDDSGNPTGGYASGVGLFINWQDGPLGRGEESKEPNGAFIEDVLKICAERMRFYQASKFACEENVVVLEHIEAAILWLGERTKNREVRDVEGTYEI